MLRSAEAAAALLSFALVVAEDALAENQAPSHSLQAGIVGDVSNFAASWSWTGVHSNEAAQLIQTLLTNTMPTRDNDENDDNKAAGSDADKEIPALEWRPADMRALLQQRICWVSNMACSSCA